MTAAARSLPGGVAAAERVTAALREMVRERPVAVLVRGDCMAPRLRDGDRVEVAWARFYWPGDVVALPTPQGRIAIHRLLGFRWLHGRFACITKGDANPAADTPLPVGLLLGRAAVRPTLGERLRAVAALAALAAAAARRRLRA